MSATPRQKLNRRANPECELLACRRRVDHEGDVYCRLHQPPKAWRTPAGSSKAEHSTDNREAAGSTPASRTT